MPKMSVDKAMKMLEDKMLFYTRDFQRLVFDHPSEIESLTLAIQALKHQEVLRGALEKLIHEVEHTYAWQEMDAVTIEEAKQLLASTKD